MPTLLWKVPDKLRVLHGEAAVGTNDEGHGGLARWHIVGVSEGRRNRHVVYRMMYFAGLDRLLNRMYRYDT